MNNDTMIKFVKRWQALEKQRKDYEFTRAVFARDLRAEFSTDAACTKWCADELGLTAGQAEELLAHARAARHVGDAATWEKLGGFRQIRQLDSLGGNRRSKIEMIEAAKSTGKRIQTLVRERVKLNATPDIAPAPTAREDAVSLARFIMKVVQPKDLTPQILAVIGRHLTVSEQKKAAA